MSDEVFFYRDCKRYTFVIELIEESRRPPSFFSDMHKMVSRRGVLEEASKLLREFFRTEGTLQRILKILPCYVSEGLRVVKEKFRD